MSWVFTAIWVFLLLTLLAILVGLIIWLTYTVSALSRWVVFYVRDVPFRIRVGAEVLFPIVLRLDSALAREVISSVKGATLTSKSSRAMRVRVVQGPWAETFTVRVELRSVRRPDHTLSKGTAIVVEPEHDLNIGYRSRGDLKRLLEVIRELVNALSVIRQEPVTTHYSGRVEVPAEGRWNRTTLRNESLKMDVVLEGTVLEFRCEDIAGVEAAINRYMSRPFDVLGRTWARA